MSPHQFPTYLSVKQVAAILGVSVQFVYKKQKQIPGYLKVAGKILYDGDALFKGLRCRSNNGASTQI